MLLVLSGSAVAAGQIFKRSPGTAAALLLAFLALASVNSPLIFPRSIGAQEAQRRSAVDGRPVVFWRPGQHRCVYVRERFASPCSKNATVVWTVKLMRSMSIPGRVQAVSAAARIRAW
jgi:hypothetical protein